MDSCKLDMQPLSEPNRSDWPARRLVTECTLRTQRRLNGKRALSEDANPHLLPQTPGSGTVKPPNAVPQNQAFTTHDPSRFLEQPCSARQAVPTPTPTPSCCEMTRHEVPAARSVATCPAFTATRGRPNCSPLTWRVAVLHAPTMSRRPEPNPTSGRNTHRWDGVLRSRMLLGLSTGVPNSGRREL
jgi:hypothetical protein